MSCRVFRLFRRCRSHMLGQMYYQICCLPSSFGCLGVWNHAFSPLFQCVGFDAMNIWQWAERISKFPTQVTTQRHWRLQGPHDDRFFSFFFHLHISSIWSAHFPKVRCWIPKSSTPPWAWLSWRILSLGSSESDNFCVWIEHHLYNMQRIWISETHIHAHAHAYVYHIYMYINMTMTEYVYAYVFYPS